MEIFGRFLAKNWFLWNEEAFNVFLDATQNHFINLSRSKITKIPKRLKKSFLKFTDQRKVRSWRETSEPSKLRTCCWTCFHDVHIYKKCELRAQCDVSDESNNFIFFDQNFRWGKYSVINQPKTPTIIYEIIVDNPFNFTFSFLTLFNSFLFLLQNIIQDREREIEKKAKWCTHI